MRENHIFRISTREKLWKKQNHKCAYCDRTITKEQASLDHVIPIDLTKESNYNEDGYVVACKRCNKEKLNYVVFTNLIDRVIYPMIDSIYFYRVNYIQRNKYK